ncbi:MAG: carboxypeptidase-like regulatory domain-containing protein [Bacteroidetes bacterium]|nr:carboxypeptidase-like regulatory domain-containing protein [Bacteroidota bacterium]
MKFKIIYLLFFVASLVAQENYVKGRVTEKSTGKPIPGVNIYFNETTSGTTSDLMGNFKIRKIIPGSHELVASMVGFEVYSVNMVIKNNSSISIDVELEEMLYEFGTAEVIGNRDNVWQRDLIFFKKIFLGKSPFSIDCEITNPYSLDFSNDYYSFKAKAREPLIIINNSLGYEIICDLLEFEYIEGMKNFKYKIKTFFKEIEDAPVGKSDYWMLNRNLAFEGSVNHFLKSLLNRKVTEEGFNISITNAPYNKIGDVIGFQEISEDSLLTTDQYGVLKKISFRNYLKVVYQDPVSNLYSLSYLLLNHSDLTIDDYGIPMELMPFQTYGSWAEKGVADMLPRSFVPQKNF